MSDIYEFIAREFGQMPSMNIVEIGGHIGTDTVRLSKFVGSGRMVVFEPDPRNIPIIQRRIANCNLNVELAQMAIGASDGEAEFHLSSGIPPYEDHHIDETQQHTASSSLKAPKNHLERFPWVKFDSVATVKTTTLDSYFRNKLEVIDFMWSDVQGAEIEMIRGGKETFKRTKFLYTEFNNNEMYEGQGTFSKLIEELPGEWGIVKMFGDEILLQNKSFSDDWSFDSHAQQCWDERYSNQSLYAKEQSKILASSFIEHIKQNKAFFEVFSKTKSILEIGCGPGELAYLMRPMCNVQNITATDCSKVAIRMASETYSKDISFKVHDGRRPFPEKFELAIASNVLQLFKNPFLLVDNMLESASHCIIMVPYRQPLSDGYDDEGGFGHVFSFNDETFNKYNVVAKMTYTTNAWTYSSAGETPMILAVLIRNKNADI